MAYPIVANNVRSTVAETYTAESGSLVVEDAIFPALDPGEFFFLAVARGSEPLCFLKITSVSGTTLTVDSAIEGTSEVNLEIGDLVAIALTAGMVSTIHQDLEDKADITHSHVISDVTGLQSALDSKSDTSHNHDSRYYTETEVDGLLTGKANSTHSHAISDVTGLQTALDGKAATSHTHDDRYYTETEVDGLLTGKASSTHSHAISDVTGLQTALDSKASSTHNHAISDVTNLQTSLDAKAAKNTPGDYGTGTPGATTYLQGDGAWTTNLTPSSIACSGASVTQITATNTSANGSSGGSGIIAYHSDGSNALSSNDRLGFYLFGGYNGTSVSNSAGILGFADGTWTSGSVPSYLVFDTCPSGTTTRSERLRIGAAGNLVVNNNVDAATSTTLLTIKSTSGHTANLAETQDASGNLLNAWGAGGSIYVANASTTASGAVNLTKTSQTLQFINPNGSNRDVNLPSVSSGDSGLTFSVKNSATSGTSVLVVKNSGGTQIGTNVPWGATLTVVYDGSNWQVI